jgi:hypothetical protein
MTAETWKRLLENPWSCASCGETHQGIFDLACARPEQWQDGEQKVSNAEVLTSKHFLSEDFCILDGEHYFVRCVLELPLIGLEGQGFGFGVWSTVSPKNFPLYVDSFDSGEQGHLGPWFGWFSNRLKDYPETLNLKCQVRPQAGRQRPLIELELTDHPLAIEQRQGISVERLMAIYDANGHKPSVGVSG